MRGAVRALALAAALIAATAADAAEEIRAYDVEIDVLADGALEVTETIRVTVEGDRIRRGIYRDFPIEYEEEDGRVSLVEFEVLEVRRNGAAEPYRRSRAGAYARVTIGRADHFLPTPSEQVYELRYRTEGQLRVHEGYDELYWNVTGDLWDFPILAASVEIRLPGRAPILRHAAYTGPRGAAGDDFEVVAAADGVYRARTTAPLGRGEGFTVAVGWPPGVVEVPPVRYGVPGLRGHLEPMTFNGKRLGPFAAFAGTLIGAIALLIAWSRVGRDPRGGAIYPQFDPPKGLSPAATRYVSRQRFDPRCLTAAILSMAVKGALRIVERPVTSLFRSSEYKLEPIGSEGRGLSVGELSAYRALFPSGAALTLKQDRKSGVRMDRAKEELKSKLWDEHYGASFNRNTRYTLGAVAVGVLATFLLLGFAERWNLLSLIQWAAPALVAGLLVHAAAFLWLEIADLRRGGRLILRRLLKLLPFAVMLVLFPVQTLFVVGIEELRDIAEPGLIWAGLSFGGMAGLFHLLMAAPSKAGRKLLDQIEGFELYMRTAEEDRLNILNPPEHTPELFERLLPYAVALGIAHEWAAKFADVLSATTGATATATTWYHGTGSLDVGALDREFSHAVAATTTPPSRSSGGSGGGGFSGGGGGGGGGGGW